MSFQHIFNSLLIHQRLTIHILLVFDNELNTSKRYNCIAKVRMIDRNSLQNYC